MVHIVLRVRTYRCNGHTHTSSVISPPPTLLTGFRNFHGIFTLLLEGGRGGGCLNMLHWMCTDTLLFSIVRIDVQPLICTSWQGG